MLEKPYDKAQLIQMKISIEKAVPIPDTPAPSKGRPCKYPWRTMETGDSFFVPDGNLRALKLLSSRMPDNFFHFREMTESGVTGVRVWKIENPFK